MLNQDAVDAAMNCAVDENGYRELIGMDAEQATIDLLNCDPDFENYEVADVLPFVKAWQASRR